MGKGKRRRAALNNQRNNIHHEKDVEERAINCTNSEIVDEKDTAKLPPIKVNGHARLKKVEKSIKKLEAGCAPIGLPNLGNTCYFNSVMQNLIQTPILHQLLKDELTDMHDKPLVIESKDDQIPSLKFVPTGTCALSSTLSEFFSSVKSMQQSVDEVMSNKKSMRIKVFSPRSLFNQICSTWERFRGDQQHDSQELYYCLLDAIKTEEIKRKRRGILAALELDDESSSKEISEEMRQRVKTYGRILRDKTDTVVEKVFGGTLISSILCDSCRSVIGVTEQFYDISLPIVEEKISKPNRHSNNSNDSEGNSPVEETTKNKPMSRRAMKKARYAAEKEAKRKRRKANRVSKQDKKEMEGLEKFSETLAEEILSLALKTMFSPTEDLTQSETNHDTIEFPKLKGGGFAIQDLNVPNEEEMQNSERKIKQDLEESEKFKENENSVINNDEEMKEPEEDDTDVEDLEFGIQRLMLEEEEINEFIQHPDPEIDSQDSRPSADENRSESPSSIKQDESFFDSPIFPKSSSTLNEVFRHLPDTLTPRQPIPQSNKISLESCFYHLTMPEILTGSNQLGCEVCTKRRHNNGDGEKKTVYSDAVKQVLIKTPPEILTIHMRRFEQFRRSFRKVNTHVVLPTILDISPYCLKECEKYADDDMKVIYGLYGMVEHVGSLSRGHYTAYVRSRSENDPNPNSGQWYHVNDTQVTKVTAAKALKCNAYLIFYERLKKQTP